MELTNEEVGAEYVSTNVWGAKRTQVIAIDDIGEMFRKQHYDERLRWHEPTVSRQAVREDLITRLTRPSPLATDHSHDMPVDSSDSFTVEPARKLRMH